MYQSYSALWYHLVWSTKNREPLIQNEWKWQLYEQSENFAKQKNTTLILSMAPPTTSIY